MLEILDNMGKDKILNIDDGCNSNIKRDYYCTVCKRWLVKIFKHGTIGDFVLTSGKVAVCDDCLKNKGKEDG